MTSCQPNRQSSSLRVLVIACLLVSSSGVLLTTTAAASDRPIADVVPVDCLVFYTSKPAPVEPDPSGEKAPDSSAAIATILTFLNAGGLIPDEGQVYADIAASLPLLAQFEHALVLLDVSSRVVRKHRRSETGGAEREVSLRLKNLQSAVVFRTDGQHKKVLAQLSRIIGRYTNTEVAQLTTERIGDHEYQRLTDERLPGWAMWEWGHLGDFFVVSFGAGAFEKMAAVYTADEPSLAKDRWFQSATVKTSGEKATAQWFIALAALEESLGEVAQNRHLKVISALKADGMTHDLWTIGRQGRDMTWYRCYRRYGKDVVRKYSDPVAYPAKHRRIIPKAASRVAIIDAPTQWLVTNVPKAWVEAQSESHIQKWSKIWSRLEQETGVDINGSLVAHLGSHVVIHDYPLHPLRIPFALTVAIEITDRKKVEMAIDALLAAWSRYLDERAERKGTTLVRVKVLHDDDGVWYLQMGILGPALKVTDDYIVISWSPQALRDALVFIEPQTDTSKR